MFNTDFSLSRARVLFARFSVSYLLKMPPHFVDSTVNNHDVEFNNFKRDTSQEAPLRYYLAVFQSCLNFLVHLLIGIIVGVCLLYSFKGGELPIGATSLHIVLCVIGFQLLMAEAILSLSPSNSWTAHFKLADKRRAHWIVQILGSGLAIAGCLIMILNKNVNWNTYHGQLALVALVFTSVSLFNGLTSLYANELRRFLPMYLSKATHICFGVTAYLASNVSLCFGIDKTMFRKWATDNMVETLIVFVAISSFIIIIDPLITFYRKTKVLVTN